MLTFRSDARIVNADVGLLGAQGGGIPADRQSPLLYDVCRVFSRLGHLGWGEDMEIIQSHGNETSKSPSPQT